MDLMIEHLIKGFLTMLLLSMPAVLTAASIGLVVGLLQAITQIQEQTIAAAPKVLGVFLVIIIMSQFSSTTLMEYFRTSANIAFNIIPKDEETVLSAIDTEWYKKHLKEEKDYFSEKTADVEEMMKSAGKIPYSDTKYKESIQKPSKDALSQPNQLEKKHINSPKGKK